MQKDNHRTFVPLKTADLATAIRKAAQVRHSPQITSGLLLENCVERFVQAKRAARERGAKRGWAWRSAHSKIYTLRMFATFCGRITPERVNKEQIKRFYESKVHTLNAQTAYGYYMTVRSFFNWCVTEHLARENPCLEFKVESPPAAPRKDFCEPELVAKLISECERDDLKYVLYCGFHAGMRALEIVESVPWWFDLKRHQLRLRKTPTIDFKDLEERNIVMSGDFHRFIQEPVRIARTLHAAPRERAWQKSLSIRFQAAVPRIHEAAKLPVGNATHHASYIRQLARLDGPDARRPERF